MPKGINRRYQWSTPVEVIYCHYEWNIPINVFYLSVKEMVEIKRRKPNGSNDDEFGEMEGTHWKILPLPVADPKRNIFGRTIYPPQLSLL